MKLCLCAVFAVCCATVSAAGQAAPSYAAEPIVFRHLRAVLAMQADGTGEETETMVVSVQSEGAAKQLSVVSLYYAKQSQRPEFVYVRVRHADGTLVETPLSDALEQAAPVTQQAPFYSDLMIKQIPVKGLRVGDTLEWQSHTVRTVAEAPGQFWGAESFVRDAVVEDQTIELSYPAGVKVNVRTTAASGVKAEESDAGGRHTYRWVWKQLNPTVGPEADALKKAKEAKPLSAAEELDATDGAVPDLSWSTFASWEQVGAWYRGVEGDRAQPDAAVRAKVAEITAGKKTEEEKVRAVYGWVSGQIRYIGVAFGIGRYQPHAAPAVLDNQYGDCKDKHTLLAAMLTALGLKPDAVLVGENIRFNRDVPSPASFNHLITRVAVDGKVVWLDSTTEVADYRVLIPEVRDKDVLVVPDAGPASIAHTPVELPFQPESTFAVVGSLDSALASDSTVTITHHDDMEIYLRAALRQLSPSQYEDAVQRLLLSYGFGGKVSEVEAEHITDPSQPLVLRFHYHRDHGDNWGENRVTATFGPSFVPAVDPKDPPHVPLRMGTVRTDTSTLEMKLPKGWSMELPEAIHKHIAAVSCDVTYRLSGGSLFAERRFTITQTKVPVADLKAYSDWYEACGADSVPYLDLTKQSAANGVAGEPASPKALVQALIYQANENIRLGKFDLADSELKQVQRLDANARDLWGDMGAVAMHRGDTTEAMKLYSKEIELHPESEFAYRNLAGLQSRRGDTTAAVQTLTLLQKRTPADPAPAIQAVQLLLSAQKNAEALQQSKALQAILTEDARKDATFRLVSAQAMMRGGEADAGEALLVALAKEPTGAGPRNDASYELAMSGRDLPFAEETERAVLAELAEESRTWTGNEAETLLRTKSSMIIAAWDTMGWILFKEGKVSEAELWIRPAMAMRQNAEVGGHLGDILMAEKKPGEAAAAYSEAIEVLPKQIGAETARAAELEAKLHTAKNSAHLSQVPDGKTGLQEMRTWKAGAADGAKGTAEFRALLAPGGAVSALPAGTVPAPLQHRMDTAKWSGHFPPGEDSRVARKVILNCHENVCEVVLEP